MITERQVVLVATNYEDNKEFRNEFSFEAIQIITDAKEIEVTWSCNKTPLMLAKHVTEDIKKNYPILEVPEFIFGNEDFIIFSHKNGFECGEYVSDQKFDTAKDRCFLCRIAKHMDIKGPLYLYNQSTKYVNDVIIYESEHFFVKIELGCLKKGMVMICPKSHVLSAANIPDEQMAEYHQVMEDVEFMLKMMYGDEPVIFFEHGSNPNGFSSHKRSIVHAHTHVAWGVKFEQRYLDMVCLEPIGDIRETKDSKYLSYQEGANGKLMVVNNPNVYVQRQFPRQVIGKMLGINNDSTNWRKDPFTENIIDTFNDFYQFLKQNQPFLSERIVTATAGFVKGYPIRSGFDIGY